MTSIDPGIEKTNCWHVCSGPLNSVCEVIDEPILFFTREIHEYGGVISGKADLGQSRATNIEHRLNLRSGCIDRNDPNVWEGAPPVLRSDLHPECDSNICYFIRKVFPTPKPPPDLRASFLGQCGWVFSPNIEKLRW